MDARPSVIPQPRQILQLAEDIQADVAEQFGVQLEIEPNII